MLLICKVILIINFTVLIVKSLIGSPTLFALGSITFSADGFWVSVRKVFEQADDV